MCLEFQLCFHCGALLSDVTLAVKLDLTNKRLKFTFLKTFLAPSSVSTQLFVTSIDDVILLEQAARLLQTKQVEDKVRI